MISIGLPVYNGAPWIREALDSVMGQSYADWELLVMDDGSEDGTVEVVREYQKDARVKLLVDGQHLGIAARLNQLVQKAQGEFFARMDADDIMMPDRLEKQLAFLQAHPEADVIGSEMVLMGCKVQAHDKDRDGFKKVERLNHPTIMGRRDWFLQNPYKEAYAGCEDYELWLRVRGKATLLQMNEPLHYYRARERYDVRHCWHERWLGLRMIWHERHLFGSTWRALRQMAFNVLVMLAVPVVHVTGTDKWVRRIRWK